MDTNDLKNLLRNQSNDTSLTPQGLWEHARRRQRARQRITAVTAVAVLAVGAGVGFTYLGALAPGPHVNILTTPSAQPAIPSSSPTSPSKPPSDTPTPPPDRPLPAPPRPGSEPKCVVPMPQSWLDAFDAVEPMTGRNAFATFGKGTQLRFGYTGDKQVSLIWESPQTGKLTISDQLNPDTPEAATDGRFVVYQTAEGQLMVWDRESVSDRSNPNYNKSTPIPGAKFTNRPLTYRVSDGRLWMAVGNQHGRAGDLLIPGANLHYVDLENGTELKLAVENKDMNLLPPLKDRAQVEFNDGVALVGTDGREAPALPNQQNRYVWSHSGDVLSLVAPGDENMSLVLHHPSWGEPVAMRNPDGGDFGTLGGNWILTGPARFYDLRSQVAMEHKGGKHQYSFATWRGEVVLSQSVDDEERGELTVKAIPLAELPALNLSCEQ